MNWVVLSIISAASLSVRSIIGKVAVDRQNEYIVAWSTVAFSLPVALLALMLSGFEIKSGDFWVLLPLRIIMDVVALISLLTAMKYKSVSFVAPLLSLTPILTMFFAFIIRGDTVSAQGVMGIVLVAISCMLIYFSEYRLTAIEDRGGLFKATSLVALTGVLFSLLDPIHPLLIQRSNEATYFFISTLAFIFVFSLIIAIKYRHEFKSFISSPKFIGINVVVGLGLGFEVLFLFMALAAAPSVALVSSLRTSNIAFTAIAGVTFLREKSNLLKWIGILGSIVGLLVISYSAI